MTDTVLRIDSSVNLTGSTSRAMASDLIDHLAPTHVFTRDLATDALPHIDDAWAKARLVAAEDRTADQNDILALSDALIAELQAADTIVLSVPLYNFSVPASVKAWVDLIARPRVTFRYSDNGPEGLLKDKRAFVVMASGGVPIGAPADFASPFLRHVLGFVGITDVTFVTKDTLGDLIGPKAA